MVKFSVTRKHLCGCDATVNPVIAYVQVIIILIRSLADFLSPIARKKDIYSHCVLLMFLLPTDETASRDECSYAGTVL